LYQADSLSELALFANNASSDKLSAWYNARSSEAYPSWRCVYKQCQQAQKLIKPFFVQTISEAQKLRSARTSEKLSSSSSSLLLSSLELSDTNVYEH